jgi:hypothetical protein
LFGAPGLLLHGIPGEVADLVDQHLLQGVALQANVDPLANAVGEGLEVVALDMVEVDTVVAVDRPKASSVTNRSGGTGPP